MSFLNSYNNAAATKAENVSVAQASVSPMSVGDMSVNNDSIMTLDENFVVAAYSGDDGNWTQHNKYVYYKSFSDDNISIINDEKDISLNQKQFNITQEENSQYIPFEMSRYYDGFDLVNATISIHYENSNKQHGASKPINVTYNNEKIRFGWLIDSNATAKEGKLKFEIHAYGTVIGNDGKRLGYVWKTKCNENLNVLQSLCNCEDVVIDVSDSWVQELVTEVAEKVAEEIKNVSVGEQVEIAKEHADRAEEAANNAEQAVENALVDYATIEYVDNAIEGVDVTEQLKDYALKSYVDEQIENVDVTEQLNDYAKTEDVNEQITNINNNLKDNYYTKTETATVLEDYATKDDVANAITEADITSKLENYYTKEEVNTAIENAEVDLTGYATEIYVDNKTSALSSSISTNTENISSLSTTIGELQEDVAAIDKSPRLTYDIAYNDIEDEDVGENVFVLYEIENEGKENEVREAKKKFTITGGSGSGSSSVLKITYVTTSPVIATVNDKLLITYNFSGIDSSGDVVPEGRYAWKVGSRIIASGIATNGNNTFDATDFATTTSQKFTLTITDDGGSLVTKSWTVQKVDVRLESNFSDAYTYNGDVSFNYTPYGAIEKEIHFVLDGEELGVVKTSTSGIPTSYPIPSQTHGSHLLEVYMTAEINGQTIGLEEIIDEESGEVVGYNHTIKVVKDILWCDPTNSVPVIGCATPTINVMQYNAVNIKYAVFDPKTETPKVTWYIGDEVASVETLTEKDDNGYYTYTYKANEQGTFVLTLTCGEAKPKVITINVKKLNINVSPVTSGLEFDFNPVGYSNSSFDRLWSYKDVTMTVSDNFDWVNGGYQIDGNGDQYFCVKAGTTAVINYNLFSDDPKKTGKEFKVIFRTKNIRKRDTSFLTCLDGGIGLDMKIENATVYNSLNSLKSDYCEDTIIEYEFNINKDTDMMIVMSYEDGAPSKPCEYTALTSFKQSTAQPITIGSEDCDVYIYRMKAYSNSLTDTQIKDNFIADARSADEMLARYNRNQIYTNGSLISTSGKGEFNVDALMKAAPDLRYIFLEVPQFTNDKENKIDDCTVYFRYPNGTRPQDNWDCTGVRHRGQGTSSNSYGYAGRNIDLCMDRDESLFTYTDEQGNEVNSRTITLTDTSVPTDYLNIKVNIASSENANNAEMARRYNEYQPFLRYARKKNSKVKDTMEFYNCVVFIRETSTDPKVPHREFNDTNWHFYAIGNVGDSKKTDDTRVNNANDPKEHVVEISDVDKPLYNFPTGKEANAICSLNEWKPGNTAYDVLYSQEYVYKDGEFKSFGGKTFEFRYEMDGITEEQREININTWRDLYKFIVTSTDEEFYANLKNYFVVDSALYYYLFTERYTMVDNRAKNSFWHYGKVYISNEEAVALGETEASYYIIDDESASINDGYRYDLTFGYDFDTSLGIDNTGDYVFSYGKEDTDYYDGSSSKEVFRASDSTFFCRLRDLFPVEMQVMFKSREERNAWDSNSLITQWDNSQTQFPEELWRLDYERKYYRTYLGLSIDNSIIPSSEQIEEQGQVEAKTYLVGKFFGRKKYARRAFEINQEMYFATKYFGQKALGNAFWFRGNIYSGNNTNLKQNYSITLTPYSDMYLCMQYSSTGTPIHSTENGKPDGKPKRIKAGESYTFINTDNTMDFMYVFAASWIQKVDDLSRCYFDDNDFSTATRLQKLVIGSTDEGYNNPFMTNVLVGNNRLLEHLDLRNVSGINSTIDVSGCSNLKEFYAEGTNATGVIFANGGLLETAHLPNTIKSLSMKNLNYITDSSFIVADGFKKLETLIVENCPKINTYEITSAAINSKTLKYLRLIGINWDSTYQIQDCYIFDELLADKNKDGNVDIGGYDSSGYETDLSVLSGNVHVSVIKEQQELNYKNAWSDLSITFNTRIEQYPVTFMNENGAVLEVQYVDKGGKVIDPTQRIENKLSPTIDSTISHDFTFAGWKQDISSDRYFDFNSQIFGAITLIATYSQSLREYTIKYVSKGVTMQTSTGKYGENIPYTGTTPTYTAEESGYVYYLFNRWDKSGFIDGEKTVNAVFDKFTYTSNSFDGKELSDLTPVEIYALTKLNERGSINIQNIITDKDPYTIVVGNDVDYDDIESELLISEKTYFDGKKHIDTGIQLFDEDKDFVLAIDYEFLSGNTPNSVLAQCFQANGSNGFKLWYNSGAKFTWGTTSEDVVATNKREILVIRHTKGDNNIKIYKSNLDGETVVSSELVRTKTTTGTGSLVFGSARADDGIYENYAIGNINWAKVWFADLGDDVCKDLAMWTHESITLEACGFRKYYLADNTSKRCSFSLLASHLLGRTKKWNVTNINVGGWANSTLNNSLNTRLYNAMPTQIKLLLKKVIVYSSIGNKSTELSSSDCYITVPALVEVSSGYTLEPYNSEGTAISYLHDNNSRKRAFDGGNYYAYWTRSPNADYTNYVYRVDENGAIQGITQPNSNSLGVLIEISF